MHERTGAQPDALVSGTPMSASRLLRPALILLLAGCIVSGLAGGLLRAGVPIIGVVPAGWVIPAASLHAALMICGFLGTVIGIERAVALRAPWAFVVPMASATGGAMMMLGMPDWGWSLFLLAAAVFVVVNMAIVKRQSATHTWLLLLSALVWLGGNVRFVHHGLSDATVQAWLSFLVLTIAAERLEMARLMRTSPWSGPLLATALALLLAGVVLAEWAEQTATILFSTGLLALALWLLAFDVARRTIRTQGLSRYMAVCLLLGYVWLAVSGLSWIALALGHASRDAALHALTLGFVVSMVMGHAPVILPAVARVKLHVDARFYVPLGLLHASLVLRLGPGHENPDLLALGSTLNAAAIALFALTVLSAAWSWRRRHPDTAPARRRTPTHQP